MTADDLKKLVDIDNWPQILLLFLALYFVNLLLQKIKIFPPLFRSFISMSLISISITAYLTINYVKNVEIDNSKEVNIHYHIINFPGLSCNRPLPPDVSLGTASGNVPTPLDQDMHPQYFYDTDYKLSMDVKRGLEKAQLIVLDSLLEREKRECGLKLSKSVVEHFARGDNEIKNAYEIWRRNLRLIRSKHRVIYPSERPLYKMVN